ncbi:MAG: hypothetical protein VX170_10450 [Pseudomonadota bacterium]|nr:hypothetical protein [Pseudomonadota bacterium]MEC9166452.1 hypothetical protein [Pseudomonadota bacterium]
MEREENNRRLCEAIGCRFISFFLSLGTGEGVVMIEGAAEAAALARTIYHRSGAFSTVEVDILHSARELKTIFEKADDFEKLYVPANRDEIDRMLLDE